MLICPFFDESDKIRGVIQLINKVGGDRIADQDILEISSICPSLSQVLKLCDISLDVQNVSAGLTRNMSTIQKEIKKKSDAFDYNLSMNEVSYRLKEL